MSVVLLGVALVVLVLLVRRRARRRRPAAELGAAGPAGLGVVEVRAPSTWCQRRDPLTGRPDRQEF